MLKGVNRQIVDIPEPESMYFERAIFFVKPEYSALSENRLKSKAEEMVTTAEKPPVTAGKSKRRKISDFLLLLLGALFGTGVSAVVGFLFF